ncbi:ribosomal RNA methyltransferase mrm2 [Pyrus ussuriensis x Pyrus communis]|uniref:rRNA methyltransferase 2, mitochondrial n=1 Tax=Pyrus ussuriensis x Pyrus communis TaxID=2448454 RepID=A0A5N5G3K3_9ROSA|nr:ribosomal RNA methyltransferase mrm2 [Pyrus ussuriensis x Pyrus communis]
MSGAGKPDFFYREAQRLGYVARSAFKLIQMQKQYKFRTPGSSVLDLGCAPGAWLQVACQSLGPLKNGGIVVGIDLKKWKIPADHSKAFSVVLLDMCPLVSGISSKDAALSLELGMQALNLNEIQTEQSNVGPTTSSDDNGVLQRGGNLVIKLLESEDVQEINQICKPLFRKASLLRPKATRSSSREIYLICQGLQSQAKT